MPISYIYANYYYTFIQLIFIIKLKNSSNRVIVIICVGRERLRARMMMARRLGNQQEVACCLPLFQLLFQGVLKTLVKQLQQRPLPLGRSAASIYKALVINALAATLCWSSSLTERQ
jgi:hypothetical protein